MPERTPRGSADEKPGPTIPHKEPLDGTAILEMAQKGEPNRLKRLLKVLGPGLITGASDDDPSGIGTYSVTGALYGYAFLWTAPWCFPLMASVQYICAKVGMVSGRGTVPSDDLLIWELLSSGAWRLTTSFRALW